jgi:hypothetical protein
LDDRKWSKNQSQDLQTNKQTNRHTRKQAKKNVLKIYLTQTKNMTYTFVQLKT